MSPFAKQLLKTFAPRPEQYGIAKQNAHSCDYCGNSESECDCRECISCGAVTPYEDMHGKICEDCHYDANAKPTLTLDYTR